MVFFVVTVRRQSELKGALRARSLDLFDISLGMTSSAKATFLSPVNGRQESLI